MTSPPERRRGRHAAPSIVDTGELEVTQPSIPPARPQLAEDVDDRATDYDDTDEDLEDEDVDDDPADLEPPAPDTSGKIESKVVAGTAGSFVISTALAQLNGMSDAQILDGLGLNPTLQFLVILFVPPLITFVAGYFTRSNRG